VHAERPGSTGSAVLRRRARADAGTANPDRDHRGVIDEVGLSESLEASQNAEAREAPHR